MIRVPANASWQCSALTVKTERTHSYTGLYAYIKMLALAIAGTLIMFTINVERGLYGFESVGWRRRGRGQLITQKWATKTKILKYFSLLQKIGYRMPAPEGATPEIYRLMIRCWSYEPESRPHFDEIYSIVDALANS